MFVMRKYSKQKNNSKQHYKMKEIIKEFLRRMRLEDKVMCKDGSVKQDPGAILVSDVINMFIKSVLLGQDRGYVQPAGYFIKNKIARDRSFQEFFFYHSRKGDRELEIWLTELMEEYGAKVMALPDDKRDRVNWFRANILRLLDKDQMESLADWLESYRKEDCDKLKVEFDLKVRINNDFIPEIKV